MPDKIVQHLSRDEVLEMHRLLIAHFGGAPGIRDMGLLESALHRPRTGYYGDLSRMATALFESLMMNHPFVDGNKRIAFFASDVFLRLNGFKLRVEPLPAFKFLISLLEKNKCDYEHLFPWISRSIVNLDQTATRCT